MALSVEKKPIIEILFNSQSWQSINIYNFVIGDSCSIIFSDPICGLWMDIIYEMLPYAATKIQNPHNAHYVCSKKKETFVAYQKQIITLSVLVCALFIHYQHLTDFVIKLYKKERYN